MRRRSEEAESLACDPAGRGYFEYWRSFVWLGDRDSNPDRQSQSLQSYR